MQNERYVHRVGEAMLPTAYGEFRLIAYESEVQGGESHIALTCGDLEAASAADEPVLVRVHTHCTPGNLFGSSLCDCRAMVDGSLQAIAHAGRGALIYLHHTNPGFGIDRSGPHPMLTLHRDGRQRAGESAGEREGRVLRQVGLGGQILSDLGVRKIRLLSNHPTHVPALQGFGIEIVGRTSIPLESVRA